MAINRRPSGWLYNGDPDYKGTTVAERRAIQNQIDIEDQLIKNNKLLEEQIEQDKKLQRAQRAILLQDEREGEREAAEERCEKLGLDLEDIEEFMDLTVSRIGSISFSDKEIAEYEDVLNKHIKELEEENIKLESKFFKISSIKKKIAKNIEEIEHTKGTIKKMLKMNEDEKKENDRADKFNADFNEFRETHYNKDVELLFRRLGYELDKVECEQEGKAEDYVEYFKTKILEN